MRIGTIYKFFCVSNNMFIVGSTLNYKRRQDYYWSYLKRGKWKNPYVQAVYNKYGKDSMKFEILQENVPEDILGFVESIWIGALCGRAEDKKFGMNMRDGDRFRLSQESRAKILQTYKNKNWPKRNPNITRPVYEKLSDGTIKIWKNTREAAEYYGFKITSVQRCCCLNKNKRESKLYGHLFYRETIITYKKRDNLNS